VVHALSSTHGTTVNGTRLVQPYALRDGDVVGMGSFELRFEETSSDVATAGLAVPQA
jgi:pSer/pThr/pTyr-binding forkhead associated (FHA) protein